MYEVGILLQCVFYIVGQITVPATCTCTYVQLHCSLWSAAGYCASCYVLYQLQLYQLPVLYQLRQSRSTVGIPTFPSTFPGTLYQLYQLLYMYNYELVPAVPAASTKAASTKAASTKLYQLLSSRCQLLSSGCQLLSSRCQLLSSECQLIFKIRQYQNISGICTS